MRGVTENTGAVLEAISNLESLKPYVLAALKPIYDISPKDIEDEIKRGIENSPLQIKKSKGLKR